MTSEEAMALAVLKGDMTAARALADAICDNYASGAAKIPPIVRIPDIKKVRVATFMRPGIETTAVDVRLLNEYIREWILGTRPYITFVGVERIELYEVP